MNIIEKIERDILKQLKIDHIEIKKIKYMKIYLENNHKKRYKEINVIKNKIGIYFFVYKQKVLYIGQSSLKKSKNSNWSMIDRIKQHFRDGDTGGIFKNIPKDNLIKNNYTWLVIVPLFDCKDPKYKRRKILFLESYLIGKYKPKYNFWIGE